MAEMYPDSAGEIRCLPGEELAIYKEYIDQGGKPQLTNPEPEEDYQQQILVDIYLIIVQ